MKGVIVMKINVSNTNMQNLNPIVKNNNYTYGNEEKVDPQKFHVRVNISTSGQKAYYSGVLSETSSNNDKKVSVDGTDWDEYFDGNEVDTMDTLNNYGKKYAKAYHDIKEQIPLKEQEKYLKQLDEAYEEAVSSLADNASTRIKEFLNKGTNNEVSFDTENFKDFFNHIAKGVKEFYIDNYDNTVSNDALIDYLDQHYSYDRGDITSASDLSLVLNITEQSDRILAKIRNLAGSLLNMDIDNLSDVALDKMGNQVDGLNDLINEFDAFKDEIENSGLSEEMKEKVMSSFEKTSQSNHDMGSKITRYQEYLEEYDELMDKIEKLEAKMEKYNTQADLYAKEENISKSTKFLKLASKVQADIAATNAKAEQVQAKISKLAKEIGGALEM